MTKNPFEIKKAPRAIISAQAINIEDFLKKADGHPGKSCPSSDRDY